MRRYFIENWRKDVQMFIIMLGLTAFFSFLSYVFYILLFLIFMILYAGRIFGMLGKASSGIHYLLIPATTAEKLVTNILLANIYYYLVLMLAAVGGVGLGTLLLAWIFSPQYAIDALHNDLLFFLEKFSPVSHVFYLNTCIIAMLIFSSVYFRKKAIVKFFLTGFVLVLFFTIFDTFLISQSYNPDMPFFDNDLLPHLSDFGQQLLWFIIPIVLTIYFWILSYLRLRETEA